LNSYNVLEAGVKESRGGTAGQVRPGKTQWRF
jgi:hypothetical protein